MADLEHFEFEEEYRDKIATVDKSGKRVWIYPKEPKGKFYNYRKVLSYILLVLLFDLLNLYYITFIRLLILYFSSIHCMHLVSN